MENPNFFGNKPLLNEKDEEETPPISRKENEETKKFLEEGGGIKELTENLPPEVQEFFADEFNEAEKE